MRRALQFLSKANINTQIIKKYTKQLEKANPNLVTEYPKTFDQKIQILNNPKTIQVLEVIEFGVKYKPSKKYIAFLLLLSGLFFYLNEYALPEKVIDRYFAISTSTSWSYFSGALFAPLMYETCFLLYVPLVGIVDHMSKFISNRWFVGLVGANIIINTLLGKYLVQERVKDYEVWDQERVTYGEATVLSFSMMLWSALGFRGGFTSLKSKFLLKTIPGLGITRSGIPVAYICIFYLFMELYLRHQREKKNTQLVLSSAITGIIGGILIRRFSPLK